MEHRSGVTSFETKSFTADICVVGGGMSGVAAAIAAARNGAKTILVQDRPVLGGNASSEIRMWVCGAHGKDNKEGGILEEIMLDNYFYNPHRVYTRWDDILYGKCITEPNLKLILNCSIQGITADGDRITGITGWHLTEQCFYNIKAAQFIDCSGDSVLRLSGAEYRWGREGRDEFGESHAPAQPDRKTMGNSILMQLRHTDTHEPFIPPVWAHKLTEADLPNRGLNPGGHNNFWWIEIGGCDDSIRDAEAIREELMKLAYGVWDLIKNHPDGRGHNWELDWIGALPGKRENVRYVGDHVLCQSDVEAEGRFDDIVAYGGWSMDDHHPEAIRYPGKPTIFHPAPSPYGIPYRCLYSKNISNLLFAGRNISATHMAMSSTRVMATCALMGQAAGTAAALCVRHALTPRGVYETKLAELQATLQEQDSYLPWHKRTVPAICRTAKLSVSGKNAAQAETLRSGVERDLGDIDNGWWAASGDSIEYVFDKPVALSTTRIVFDSDFGDTKRQPAHYPKEGTRIEMPKMLAKSYTVAVKDASGAWKTVCEESTNLRRLVTLPLAGTPVSGIKLTVTGSWGDSDAHVFAFDAQ